MTVGFCRMDTENLGSPPRRSGRRRSAPRRRVWLSAPVRDKARVPRPSAVECGYCRIDIERVPYLVLETHGSSHRVHNGTPSQSLHLDRAHAAELKALLQNAFPGI